MGSRKNILVVEDESLMREGIAHVLKEKGYDVSDCKNGEDALRAIMETHPDLVILDLGLPRLPGEEVCKRIRANEKTKDIPVIMLTGKAGSMDKVIGNLAGASSYVTKPFELEDLCKEIEKFLQ